MKMIRAIVRLEKEEEFVRSLEQNGIVALTRMDVTGRGSQGGIDLGHARYEEVAKCMFLLVVEDEQVPLVVETIQKVAQTGNFGDGRIFIGPVEAAYTIRTGKN